VEYATRGRPLGGLRELGHVKTEKPRWRKVYIKFCIMILWVLVSNLKYRKCIIDSTSYHILHAINLL